MSTKRQHIYIVKELLDKTDDAKNTHPAHIEQAMSSAFSEILYDTFKKNPRHLDFYGKEYVNQTVSLDSNTNRYYTNLPAPILQTPDMDFKEGVRFVSVNEWEDLEFYPTNEADQQLMYGSEAFLIDDAIGYIVRTDKIIYNKNMTAAMAANKVRLLLIVPFSSYADTDEIPIPSGKHSTFYQLTLQFLSQLNLKTIENG